MTEDLDHAGGNPERTDLYHRLTSSSTGFSGGAPWSLVIADEVFGADLASLDLLESVGATTAACGGILMAGAHCHLVGCACLYATPDVSAWAEPDAHLAARWESLRRSHAARSIGLALPRYLLRRPYGAKSEPIETFRFEELPSNPPHDAYLWANPAFACAALIAHAWVEPADTRAGTLRLIDDVPYHLYDGGAGLVMKPCAEVFLSERTARVIQERGIIPLLSVRDKNAITIPGLQSISVPPATLV
jgi:type VI secretion system ImpC/EvpB family protein